MKSRKHVLTDKYPMLCAIAWMLLGIYGPNILVATLAEPLYETNQQLAFLVFFGGVIVISMLMWVLFERRYYPEYDGSMHIKGISRGFRYAAPVILFMIVYRIFKFSVGFEKMYPIDLDSILRGCRPGFSEEILFQRYCGHHTTQKI